MRRALALFLGILMLLTMLPATAFAEPGDAGASVLLDETNFPDSNFRTCLAVFDTDNNGALSPAECQAVTVINCHNMNIASLEGIEYFVNLTSLNCSQNRLMALDVSALTALKYLSCGSNVISELTLPTGAALEFLDCCANSLTALDVSDYTALTNLTCYANRLTTLDVSGCTALQKLYCFDNCLTALDVTGCTALQFLDCFINRLTALDVSDCTALERFNCSSNELTALDVTPCTKLIELNCADNALEQLATGALTALESLDCTANRLTALDVSANAQLRSLRCAMNGLTELHMDNDAVLWELQCGGNSLTALDVSTNGALKELDCAYNNLTALNVSHNTNLTKLYCAGNRLAALDVSHNGALEELGCGGNSLTALDVSSNTNLAKLHCADNALGTLDVSHNAVLRELNCADNTLTVLDLTSLMNLHALDCSDNALQSLDTRQMVCDEYANAPQVCYDGNPLTDASMGETVRVAHAGAAAPLHLDENNGILRFVDEYAYDNDEMVTTACATVTDYHADGNKTEWLCYQPDPVLTLKLNPAGERRFGCKTLRDTVSGLQSRGITDIYVVTDQSAEAPWNEGHYEYSLHIGHDNPNPQQTRILGEHDALRAVKVVDGVTLTQYSGGNWERTTVWNEETQSMEYDEVCYHYAMDPLVELTLSQEAADLYNNGSTAYTARLSTYITTLAWQLGWPSTLFLNEDEVDGCGSYTACLKIDGLSGEFDVEIVPGPVEELAVASRQPLEIMEGTCGGSATENDEANQEHTYFHYGQIPDDVTYTATFTDAWAAENNGGRRSFTGTASALTELLGEAPVMGSAQRWDAPWYLGETYDAVISVPGAKCGVSVKIINGPIESIVPILSQPLALIENGNGRWESVNGEPVFVYGTQSWHEQLRYLVLFSDKGAAYYGQRSFIGQLYQVEELVGANGHFEGEQAYYNDFSEYCVTPWEKGSHEVTLHLLGADCTVPVEVVDSPLAEVALVDETPIELERGLDGYWKLGETEDGAPGHFYYDFLNRQVWDELTQYWQTVSDRVVATFTDAGMARCGVARSGEYNLHELAALLEGDMPECPAEEPGENWAVGEEHTLSLSVSGYTLTVPVKIVAPRVELEALSFKMSETNPLAEGCGMFDLSSRFEYTLTYKERGDAASTTATMSDMDMQYRWGIQPMAEPDRNSDMSWRAGETYQITACCMDKVATATVVPPESGGSVALTAENFPDSAFLQFLRETYDPDGDGMVPVEQVESITLYEQKIQSLEGIALFTKLSLFDYISTTGLTTLDLSGCTALRRVYCGGSTLETLNVSGCTALRKLDCDGAVKTLDASGCTALRELDCDGVALEALNVSGCTSLYRMECNDNDLAALNLSDSASLRYLDCNDNDLAALDVSDCALLRYLDCGGNDLTALDISHNASLYYLDCSDNRLTVLNVTNCTALGHLFCGDNGLTALDVSHCTSLEALGCGHNALTSLNLANNTALRYLYCSESTGLTELNVGNLPLLSDLVARDCPALNHLYIHHIEDLWLDTFGASPDLQVTVGGTALIKKTILSGSSALGDSAIPLELCLESGDGLNVFYAVTDNSAAVFGNLTGQYTVTVSKDGYVPCTVDIDLDSGNGAEVKIVRQGDLNGIAGQDMTAQVDELDCQRIYEVLNGETPLETDENLAGNAGKIQYAQKVADTNDDGTLNILDYQFLYEAVLSQREQSR